MIIVMHIYFSFFSRGFSFFARRHKRKKRLAGCSPKLSYSGVLLIGECNFSYWFVFYVRLSESYRDECRPHGFFLFRERPACGRFSYSGILLLIMYSIRALNNVERI